MYNKNNIKEDIENVKINDYVLINFNNIEYEGILKSKGRKNISILTNSKFYGEQLLKFNKSFLMKYIPYN
jgi:hypothetical protein